MRTSVTSRFGFINRGMCMGKGIALFAILLLVLASLGCTSGRTMVMAPPSERLKADSANVVMDTPTVSVPPDVMIAFATSLDNALFVGEQGKTAPFTKGPNLTINCRIIQFASGSQFKRWLAGGIGGYGEGSMTVEVRFINSGGKEISKIQSDCKIGAGVFGGSIEEALSKCAEEIATYAQQNFR